MSSPEENQVPSLIVLNLSKSDEQDLIKNRLLKDQEVVFQDSGNLWNIRNKYYSAQVNVIVRTESQEVEPSAEAALAFVEHLDTVEQIQAFLEQYFNCDTRIVALLERTSEEAFEKLQEFCVEEGKTRNLNKSF